VVEIAAPTEELQPFRRARRKTLGSVIAAVGTTGQVRWFAIAITLATWPRTRLDSQGKQSRSRRHDYALALRCRAR